MNKNLVNLICSFIPSKEKRHNFRKKYFKYTDINVNRIINHGINNVIYEIVDLLKKDNLNDIIKFPIVKSREETLDYIIKNKVSISRFGDGEFMLLCGESMGFQQHRDEISERMKEILLFGSTDKFLCCIPDVFGYFDYTKTNNYFWRDFISVYRNKIYKYLNFSNTYYNARITRIGSIENKNNKIFLTNYFNKFKLMWKNRTVVIIEGEKSRLGVGNDLFNNTTKIERILCPVTNAYNKYNDILNEAKLIDKDKLILIALGPTATILAYDLFKEGFQALDIGHIDIEYEWFLMSAIEKVPIKNKYVLEAGCNDNIEDTNDIFYKSQIIKTIL